MQVTFDYKLEPEISISRYLRGYLVQNEHGNESSSDRNLKK